MLATDCDRSYVGAPTWASRCFSSGRRGYLDIGVLVMTKVALLGTLPLCLAAMGPTAATLPGHDRIDLAIRLLKSLETPDPAAARIIDSKSFVQHNLALPDGPDATKAFYLHPPKGAKVRIVRAFADGDYVVTQSLVHSTEEQVVIDLFRFSGNHVVEHWDNSQVLCSAPNLSGRTQFDGPTEVSDLDKTEANKASLKAYSDAVVFGGHYDRVPEFKVQVDFHQHNCDNGDTKAAAEAAGVTPPAFKITK